MNSYPDNKQPVALVIDDDPSLRIAMRAALSKSGFKVVEAENGQQGIQLFSQTRPDLILLDVVMPGMNGYETCSSIRQLPGGDYVQILMVTGLDDTESIEKAFEAGASSFIAKPINWSMLGHRGKYMIRAGKAFQELDKSKKRLAKTQQLAKLGNWEIDLLKGEFHCSIEACKLLDIQTDTPSISFELFLSSIKEDEKKAVSEKITNAIHAQKSFTINYQITNTDGAERYILNHAEVVFNDNNEPELMLGAVQDVTDLKKAEEEIRYLAFYDGLTGLANRMLFHDRLEQEILSAKRYNQTFALLYLDLDQFKRVNDTFGHHIGDQLLQNVSDTLQRSIRSSDTASRMYDQNQESIIARLGGDEFTLIISDLKEPEQAAYVARRIMQELLSPFIYEGHEIVTTTSIGISLYPADGTNPAELLKHADTAMYQAKKNGRNNYQFYKKSHNIAAIEKFSLEQDIGRAVENNEFELYYQPKITTKTQSVVGAEALIRWHHPKRGMIPPNQFIQIAEESGQIIAINEWVIRAALNQIKKWQQDDIHPGKIAINLSGYQFAKQNLITTIHESLLSTQVKPELFEIEITENVLMRDTERTALILQELKNLGITIALDDFGTGYSSLSYLTTFDVNTIKIDRSFVMECTDNPSNLVIIKAIIAMGHSLGLKIVAEGVETEEQFNLLRDYGADEAQGYYFAPPLPCDKFLKFLAQR